jgi:hypothetical protein
MFARTGLVRAFKTMVALAGLMALGQYVPAYYHTLEYTEFINIEVRRAKSEAELRQSLLLQAQERALPVTESDITISNFGRAYKVAVNYSVPINLVVYTPRMKFEAVGSGPMR